MKKKNLGLSVIKVQSFVTTLNSHEKIRGGMVCPEISRIGEECVSAHWMEGCPSTGTTDDPTGFFTADAAQCN